jgi:hypothetical protein
MKSITIEQKTTAPSYLDEFKENLTKELNKLRADKSKKPPGYGNIPEKGLPIIEQIYQWLLDNPGEIKQLSVTQPLRFAAAKNGRPHSQNLQYPFGITIHLTVDKTGNVHLVFDPNSKFFELASTETTALESKTKKKEQKSSETQPTPKEKIRGEGAQKKVRDTWTFNSREQRFEPSVANVVKRKKQIEQLNNAQNFVSSLPEYAQPFLMRSRPGAEYQGHDESLGAPRNQRKAISFAPRAQGTLEDLRHAMSNAKQQRIERKPDSEKLTLKNGTTIEKPNLSQMLQLFYSTIGSVALLHVNGKMHRDIKLENFLLFASNGSIDSRLNDYDNGVEIDAKTQPPDEVCSLGYIAYDRKNFLALIGLHNELLENISQKKEHYLSWSKKNSNTCTDEDYIRDHITDLAQQIYNNEKEAPAHKAAIEIIISKNQKIESVTGNNPQADIWALCQTLLRLSHAFAKMANGTPLILHKLEKLMETICEQSASTRMDAITLFNKVDDLINAWSKLPADQADSKAFAAVSSAIKDIKLAVRRAELIQELKAYEAQREAHPKNYYGVQCYGRLFGGYTKKQKMEASAALRAHLENKKALTSDHVAPLLDESLFTKGLKSIVTREKYKDIIDPILNSLKEAAAAKPSSVAPKS